MKARLLRDLKTSPKSIAKFPKGIVPKGTVVECKNAWFYVKLGVAEPADEECKKRANMTPDKIARQSLIYERTERGIHPKDFEAYEAGLMTGYNPDGSWIPGPAYEEPDQEEIVDEPEIEEEALNE